MWNLGTFIKKRRKAAGLTQKQLAQKIGRAEITIRQYEGGSRTPDLQTKVAIANALNFAYDDFELDADIEEPAEMSSEAADADEGGHTAAYDGGYTASYEGGHAAAYESEHTAAYKGGHASAHGGGHSAVYEGDNTVADDPGYLAYLENMAKKETLHEEGGHYDVGTRKVGARIINELFYYPPRLSLDGLTKEEIKRLREYREFLLWKRTKKQPDDNYTDS